jgi:ribosomal protein S12 methylthiotransferase
VPADVKERRRDAVMALQQGISLSRNRAMRGRRFDALLEGPCTETDLILEGRLASQAPEIDGRLLINDVPEGAAVGAGQLVRVEVTGAHAYDLVGRVVRASA